MVFKFNKKPITLYCVTDRPEVARFAPVQRASKFLPEWWKQLPKTYTEDTKFYKISTMRNCYGFVDLYSRGAIVPMWSDLALRVSKTGDHRYQYQYADGVSEAEVHPPLQYKGAFSDGEYQHFKLSSPWGLVCQEDIKFLLGEPTWSLLNLPTLRVAPGVVSFKYQTVANNNIFIKKTHEEQHLLIPFLQPIMHIVPLSDRPLKIVVSEDLNLLKHHKLTLFSPTFRNKFKVMEKLLRRSK